MIDKLKRSWIRRAQAIRLAHDDVELVKRTGCRVERGGVLIAPCDELGRTALEARLEAQLMPPMDSEGFVQVGDDRG